MSYARDMVYSFVNRMAQFAMRNPNGLDYRSYQSVEAGSGCYEDLELRALLNQVEDDRAHTEAVRLRKRGEQTRNTARAQGNNTIGIYLGAALIVEALAMDPYEERDGQLVRKDDGQPVTL